VITLDNGAVNSMDLDTRRDVADGLAACRGRFGH